MTINLNNTKDLTFKKVRSFIASSDDSIARQIRVTAGGIAFVSDTTGAQNIEGLAFRFESYDAGNGYLGIEASEDNNWVNEVLDILKENWPKPKADYIDY
jgi:hypothetical protein